MCITMIPKAYQIETAEQGTALLKKYGLVYLSDQERVGKTLPSLMILENVKARKVLVLTKKQAIGGWLETIRKYEYGGDITVTNYHQAVHLLPEYSMVILDESHNYISSFTLSNPQRSKIWHSVKKLTRKVPIIFISATPNAQGYHLLYNQFALSTYSPYREWNTPALWFKEFGIPRSIMINTILIKQYDKVKNEAWDVVKHLFISKTREEVGFDQEPEDKVHYVELADKTKLVYNTLTKHKSIRINGEYLTCDSTGKLRSALHMIEGGVVITTVDKKLEYRVLGNTEKIDYIKETWGDTEDVVIMYFYKAERTKLESHFHKATILQSSRYAEGVDLHKFRTLVVYSMDFSTAKYTQRRARQANMKRVEPITVHYLLATKAISDQVYTAVAKNKTNFVDRLYTREML